MNTNATVWEWLLAIASGVYLLTVLASVAMRGVCKLARSIRGEWHISRSRQRKAYLNSADCRRKAL